MGTCNVRWLLTVCFLVLVSVLAPQRVFNQQRVMPTAPLDRQLPPPDPEIVYMPIQLENMKAGTSEWQVTNPANRQKGTGFADVEGYADKVSLQRGEVITFYINSIDPSVTFRVFRMGWYGGLGGREMMAPQMLSGIRQNLPQPTATGLIEAAWTPSLQLIIPDDWLSGVYVAKLSGKSGEDYIIFVVRDDTRQGDFLFQTSVATYQAYNSWGGKSTYNFNSIGGQWAHKVSFDRPYVQGLGAGDFFFWEIHMVRFLEREGFDVSYSTDLDTHNHGDRLLLHKAFLSAGHDEYWSSKQRANVERALNSGVSLGFFGANTCYWQVRYEPGRSGADRVLVAFKDDASKQDPMARDPASITYYFRFPPINHPEEQLLGSEYDAQPPNIGNLVVANETYWILDGTGLHNGDVIPGLLGYEVDRRQGNEPPQTQTVFSSPYVNALGQQFQSTVTVYQKGSAYVVNTGSMQWNWGLDDFQSLAAGWLPGLSSLPIKIATANILARFAGN